MSKDATVDCCEGWWSEFFFVGLVGERGQGFGVEGVGVVLSIAFCI